MKEIALSWNSRTKNEKVLKDKDFKEIVEFLNNRNPNEWIFGFYSCDNNETREFIKKLERLLMDAREGENFHWINKTIVFSDKDAMSNTEKIIKELKDFPKFQSGILALFEPIDFDCMMPEVMKQKYSFHTKLVSLLSDSSLTLFVFENINFDLEYIEENSPLEKHVKHLYKIPGYRADELKILKPFKNELGQGIVDYCDGQSEIISKLENFWRDISLEDRLKKSAANFIDLPIQTFLSEVVRSKLISISRLLDRINKEFQDQIEYNSENNTILIKMNQNFIKNQFLKTGLFNCEIKIDQKYLLTPRKQFEEAINESKFIHNKGNIQSSFVLNNDYSDIFSQIATYFNDSIPTFILGAGNSLTSGAPDRKRMFQHILKTVYKRNKSQFDNMSYKELKNNFQKLINSGYRKNSLLFIVRDQLNAIKPSVGHFHLSQLVKEGKVKLFITTNFDTLLEDSLMDYGIRSKEFVRLVAKGKKMAAGEWEWVNKFPGLLKIFKICGDIYYGSSMAVDDNTANIWIETAVAALEQVKAYRDSDFFIILGHKFEEIDLNRIFDNRPDEDLTIIYANPNESDCEKFKDRHGHKCSDLKLINGYYGEFDNFMQELCQCLREGELA
jgi:hypothetical protein